MRKFLISTVLAASTFGLVACGDNVDENATGSVNDPVVTDPAAPATTPVEPLEEPMTEPAPAE